MSESSRGPPCSGAGSWGTAFAKMLADAGRDVTLWARRPESPRRSASRHNPTTCPTRGCRERVTATADAAEALDGADLVVLAVPSQTLRDNLAAWAAHDRLRRDARQPDEGHRAGHRQADERGHRRDRRRRRRTGSPWSPGPTWPPRSPPSSPPRPWSPASTRSGPTLVQRAIATPYFRPYTNDDVIGCELGGAVKNVIALAYGMATAMGLGDNTKATLITRGLAETARLGVALGADPLTFAGLAGLGDLVAHLLVAAVAQPHLRRAPRPRARRWSRRRPRPGRPPRASRAAWRSATSPARTASRCRSPSRSSGSATRASTRQGRRRRADEPGDEARMTVGRLQRSRMTLSDGDGDPRCARRAAAGRCPGSRSCPVRSSPRPTISTRHGPRPGVDGYGRSDNPTRRALEAAIGELEGGDCVVFASGMAAITAVLMTVLRPGDTVVLPADGYYKTRASPRPRSPSWASRVVEAPTAGPYPSFDGVRLVLLETPANPGLDVCDIAALAARRARRPARSSRSTTPRPRRSASARSSSARTSRSPPAPRR